MNVHSFFFIPGDLLQLSDHSTETLWVNWISCGVAVVVYEG